MQLLSPLLYLYRPQRSCGKVMFSQAILFTMGSGRHPPPQQTVTAAADGTHPTGMNSSTQVNFIRVDQNGR